MITHIHLLPRLRMIGAVMLLLLYVFVAHENKVTCMKEYSYKLHWNLLNLFLTALFLKIRICWDVMPCGLLHWNLSTVALFVDMYTKLQKVSVSFVTSVCLSTWNNSAPTGQIFVKVYVLSIFLKICWKNSYFIILDRNNWYFTWRSMCIYGNITSKHTFYVQ
jgi:hypothetical protein